MKSKILIISLIVVSFIVLIFFAAHAFYQYRLQQPFTCRAELVQKKDETMLNLSLKFMFKNGYGTAAVNGKSVTAGDDLQKISMEVYFTYQQDGDFYALTNRRNIKFPDNSVTTEWLGKYLPDFYVKSGQELYLTISRQDNDNNLFFIDAVPLLVCKTTRLGGR